MKIRLDQRLFGIIGFLGFLGFIPGNFPLYMLFMLFFFFVAARPQTKTGEYLNDERWVRNITKACATSIFVFLTLTMLNIAFLRISNVFSTISLLIPVAALLSFFLSFYYCDQTGD